LTQFVGKINGKLTNLSLCENLSLSEVKYASRLVTSDKVLSFNRQPSDVNNLLGVCWGIFLKASQGRLES
jgi:hypothetical protein